MTQSELSQYIGCTPAMLSFVLSGQRTFSYRLAKKISRRLNTGVDLWANPEVEAGKRREAFERYRGKKA